MHVDERGDKVGAISVVEGVFDDDRLCNKKYAKRNKNDRPGDEFNSISREFE